jgi:hypothetical protein
MRCPHIGVSIMEDETDIANIIIVSDLYERERL